MNSRSQNYLLVGGGITSSLISFLSRKQLNYTIHIWEKHAIIGGRMMCWKSKYSSTPIDVGAQYISTDKLQVGMFKEMYDFLLENEIIQPLKGYIENQRPDKNLNHFVAPAGMNSLVERFFSSNHNCTNVCVSKSLATLDIVCNKIIAVDRTGREEIFDSVILTMPVPEILQIRGNFREKIGDEMLKQLSEITYSSRLALILVYDHKIDTQWVASYLESDDILRYVSIQEKKVERSGNVSSVVFHSTIKNPKALQNHQCVIDYALSKFPEWGKPIEIRVFEWKYSQVVEPFPNTPGCVTLCSQPTIILTGDGFSKSNLDGCLLSAAATVESLKSYRLIP